MTVTIVLISLLVFITLNVLWLPIWADYKVHETKPDIEIKDEGFAFLHRWVILDTKLFKFYLHHQIGPDAAQEFHDHPWWNLSVILSGGYIENFPSEYDNIPVGVPYYLWPENAKLRKPGQFILRKPETAHRITLPTGVSSSVSLFFTGPSIRVWGFWCPEKGWIPWQTYCTESYNGQLVLGKRCD